jgi:GNAT superfamily N-acetyltransferase
LWVDSAWRGRGIGREVMTGIEDAASALDLSVLRIETGDRQPEAVSLYEGMGWERIFVTPEGAPLPAGWIRFRKVVA